MHSKLTFTALASSVSLLASTAMAQLIVRPPSPTPLPSRPPSLPSPTVPPSEESIPVVIAYGDGTDTRVQITRGIMEPVGIPPNQPVTVTLYLASGIPGSPVQVGLFDGGKVTPAVAAPSPDGGNTVDTPLTAPILVLADQTVRFNFQSGLTLGLYRALVTIGPKQYLLQFYAVRPRPAPSIPLPSPPPAQ